MRKMWMLLALLLLCAPALAENVRLEPANDLLPEDWAAVWLVDDDTVLVGYSAADLPSRELVNLTTGERIPVTLHEDFVPVGSKLAKRFPEMALREGFPMESSLRFAGSSRYVYLHNPVVAYYVDRETGALQSVLEDDIIHFDNTGLTSWDEVYKWSSTQVGVYSRAGSVLNRFTVDEGAYVAGVIPVEQGFLIMTLDNRVRPDPEENPLLHVATVRLVLTDKRMNVVAERELGGVPYVNKVFNGYRCEGTGAFLLSPDIYAGALLFTPEWDVYALVKAAGEMQMMPYEDALDVMTGMFDAYAYVVGVADDGSYALVHQRDEGLYRIDLATLEVTLQMTQEELEALGIAFWPRLMWPGGEYVDAGGEMLLRIVPASQMTD